MNREKCIKTWNSTYRVILGTALINVVAFCHFEKKVTAYSLKAHYNMAFIKTLQKN